MTSITPVAAAESVDLKAGLPAEPWRMHAPQLPPPRPLKLPAITTYKLANGLTVQLVEDHRVPFVTVNLGVKAGSARDSEQLHGIASMTADMLTEGTKTLTSKQIADEIDFIGGALKGGADQDFTLLVGSSLSGYTDRLMGVVADVVKNPTFPDDELKLKKANLIQELAMKRSQPDFLLEERFSKVVYGEHPYGVVAPTPAEVEKFTRNDLVNFHKEYFVPNESVLIVVGDFDITKMKAMIDRDFGESWKAGHLAVAKYPALPKYQSTRIYLVDRPGSVQSSIKLGNPAISKTDPDYFPMIVMNQILGGAAHSRLFLNIREQKGYTYGAYSHLAARAQPGDFAAEAEVRTEVTAPSLQEFLYELQRIRNVKVGDKELKDAKAYLTGSFSLGLETQAGLAYRLLESQLYGLPADYLEKYQDRVIAVTADQLRAVARKEIDLANISIVIVGDAKHIKHELEYFAPVEVWTTEGKPVQSAGHEKPTKKASSH